MRSMVIVTQWCLLSFHSDMRKDQGVQTTGYVLGEEEEEREIVCQE